MTLKIKALVHGVSEVLLIAFVFVVMLFIAFGLGRLSVLQEARPEVRFEASVQSGSAVLSLSDLPTEGSSGGVVGSKKGTKYHFPWCAGALTISEQNKRFFVNEAEARALGYTPAANCKGLK